MTADEMIIELGYKKEKSFKGYLYHKTDRKKYLEKSVIFNAEKKEVFITGTIELSRAEEEAIDRKIEELEWYDGN